MLFFLMIAKYDIHMFQLASYRNSRYFRWLAPNNIISIKRLFAVAMLAAAFIPGYFGSGFATGVTAAAWFYCFSEKFKTPLVYTMRVKRLFATNIILFAIIATLAVLFAGTWAMAIIGAALVFSNFIMLLANIVNIPIEKAINRHYSSSGRILRISSSLLPFCLAWARSSSTVSRIESRI